MLDLVELIEKRLKYAEKEIEPESIDFYFSEIENKLVMALRDIRSLRKYYSSSNSLDKSRI